MKLHTLQKRLRDLLMVCAVLGMSHHAQALLIVNSAVSPGMVGPFHWEFTVENTGPTDFVIVSLNAPTADPFIGMTLIAPAGFLSAYDSVLGFVDFFEDTLNFAAGTLTAGFSFESSAGPGDGYFNVFTAIDTDGNVINGAVPEPISVSLVALGGLLAGFLSPKKKPQLATTS
jgi:hypothetical protein